MSFWPVSLPTSKRDGIAVPFNTDFMSAALYKNLLFVRLPKDVRHEVPKH